MTDTPQQDPSSAAALLSALKDQGVTHVVGLPDNTSAGFLALAELDRDITTLPVTREGEAFAVASGLWLGGKAPVVVVQNTGLLESGDSVRGTAVRMGVPLLCLVTYRGYWAMRERAPEPQAGGWGIDTLTRSDLDSVALYTEPTLRAWGIPYRLYASGDPATVVRDAWEQAHRDLRPVALLVTQALT
jgi:sulfopyruvate decarboxylase subunit alpha